MKAKLLTVLNQCIYNKPIADYKALTELINSIDDDSVKDINIEHNKTGIYVSMFNSDYELISMSFTDSNKLLFCLPDNASKTYVIDNSSIGQDCSYTISYSDLSNILNNDK